MKKHQQTGNSETVYLLRIQEIILMCPNSRLQKRVKYASRTRENSNCWKVPTKALQKW